MNVVVGPSKTDPVLDNLDKKKANTAFVFVLY